ncbi:unnamed protein product [Prorocentrum cordatum]|uniref:Uncharacterized protein n=1 Tax=Prorocentrum cordatum TaxID=2364126 RepID=A0ABN9V5L2_9DINO|nr:unnamed protein product [Polarella glacialis]
MEASLPPPHRLLRRAGGGGLPRPAARGALEAAGAARVPEPHAPRLRRGPPRGAARAAAAGGARAGQGRRPRAADAGDPRPHQAEGGRLVFARRRGRVPHLGVAGGGGGLPAADQGLPGRAPEAGGGGASPSPEAGRAGLALPSEGRLWRRRARRPRLRQESGALLRKGGGKADPSRGTDNDRGGRAAPSSGPSRKGGGKADSSWDADYDRGGRAVPSSRGSDRPRGGDAGEPPPSALGLGDRLAWDRRGAAAPGASWGAGGARGNGWSGAGQWGEAGGWESWRSGGWWGGGAGWWESPGGEQRGDRAAGGGAAEAPRRWRPGAGAGQRGTPSQRHQ